MALIREYEERVMELRTAGEVVGPVHPYIGQEAIAVGVCAALRAGDSIVSHYRGHGHALARGVSMDALTAELLGRKSGLCGGRAAALVSDPAVNLLLSSGIIGAGIPIAAGAAMTSQVRGSGDVAVVFLGDGGLGSGVVHETLLMATAQRLPLILVCEHNSYQGGTRSEEVYPDLDLTRIPLGHRMRTVSVDGNDVTAVHEAAAEAVAAARSGAGPTFVEARTYLTRFHLQFDKPSTERRPAAELAHWLDRDPLQLAHRRLLAAGTADEDLAAVARAAAERVAAAVAFARSAPWPAPSDVSTNVWAEKP
ncbi:thiamine pyrophosphate-dependent dehydrogenase E1 component subunit alpha [Kitasatospora phosalacinea]|nr:thiamine pyrophosphate-dependent dehydrogenase E1 component subunit alpha [Kitasatospora phosalacinea]